jgi:energy-coupling factor transport system permease protein
MMGGFSSFHPAVNFFYFALVLGFTMFLLHPACLVISLTGALLYAGRLKGGRATARQLAQLLPLFLLTALMNPLFNHRGITILAYFPGGNPLTWESILYGLAAAALFGAVIVWFTCYHRVMTSDKFLYLFGKVIPALSLLLSMALRFVPRFKARLDQVRLAQRAVGGEKGGARERLHRAACALSALATWSMESAIETADSMKCRGYGLPGRTSYAPFRLEGRDKLALACLGVCGVWLGAGALLGGFSWRYFPAVGGWAPTGYRIALLAVYALLCGAPVLIDSWEGWRWRHLCSKI